ncbi:uncharacterized protein EI90DRAFT_3152978 [Cantharellus anzutake]|uniref:uncharacterized protein n=1 Tax=Cantharellus anzutake TaxID=1750568 RepID=UPI001908440D|nr:uncharacterized protein EI90DRAFT_3152978 [Cantharellus anzutake]KAF8335352.1 hypothetical protein EI90DRAFT_3152978 [Cantharellus anzutake]
MAAIALSVPLARMTSSKTSIAIKEHQRNNKRRASSSSSMTGSTRPSFLSDLRAQYSSSPPNAVFMSTPSAPITELQPLPQPVPVFVTSSQSLAVPLLPSSAEFDGQSEDATDTGMAATSTSTSEPTSPKWKFKLLPEKLIHFNPSKDPRLLAL